MYIITLNYTANRCPIEGQVFRLCASACTATCENPNPICTQECQAKCTCIGGRVVDRRVNKCVDSDQCGKLRCTVYNKG